MSYEIQLCALALLLYLYDSTVLLFANEALLSCDRRGTWHVITGSSAFVVAGRQVCFLTPVRMSRPCARLRWNLYGEDAGGADVSWSQELAKLPRFGLYPLLAALALFGVLPLGLFTALGTRAVATAVVLLYGSILIGCITMRRHCALPAFSRLRFAVHTLECLACPPFGVNLIRRLSLMIPVRESLLSAAERLVPPAARSALLAHCEATLLRELAGLTANAVERPLLEHRLLEIRGRLGSG